MEIPEFYHICGVRDGSAWARLDFPAESCPAGSPSCCSPAPRGCGSISCSLPSLDFQAQGAGLGLMGVFPLKQNEVLIFLLRRDSFCPVLGYVGRSREVFLPRQSRSICASTGSNLNFPIFSCRPRCREFPRNLLCQGSFPLSPGTPERISWFTPGSWCHCHSWRGECGEPGEGALAGRLSPLVSTAADEHWIPLPAARTGAAVCPSYSPPSTQTRGMPCWGHHRDTVTSSPPLAGFNPGFISFQRLTKGISGVPGSGALFSQSPAEGWECLGAK